MRSSDVQPDIVPGQRVRHRRWMRRTRIRVGTTVDRAGADPGVRTEPNPVRPATADIPVPWPCSARCRGRDRDRHGDRGWHGGHVRGQHGGHVRGQHEAVTDTMSWPARCRDRGPSLPIQPRVRTRCIPPAQGSASCLVSGGSRMRPIRRTRRVSADTRLRSPAPSPRHRHMRQPRTAPGPYRAGRRPTPGRVSADTRLRSPAPSPRHRHMRQPRTAPGPRRAGRRPHPSAYPPAHRRRATRSEDPGPAHEASDSRYSFDRRTSAIGPSPSGSPTRIVSCSSTHQPSKPTAASAATIAGRSTFPRPSGT
ncbi:hypothetical protein EDD28_1306 [Salana multivorans]|uniref:Uncharacterized protein n=1 Tax=Salana multivorans TaxID=120377 RepID=A0A3N2DA82_9MICO|nr:hypothetical protein EDD28_1306 [Salana multivorans]